MLIHLMVMVNVSKSKDVQSLLEKLEAAVTWAAVAAPRFVEVWIL